MSSLKHVYLGMGDGVACWGTLLGGSGFKSRPKYDLFLTPCTSADVPWKKVDTRRYHQAYCELFRRSTQLIPTLSSIDKAWCPLRCLSFAGGTILGLLVHGQRRLNLCCLTDISVFTNCALFLTSAHMMC